MTIVIKAEEINRLIHRYLVEQGTIVLYLWAGNSSVGVGYKGMYGAYIYELIIMVQGGSRLFWYIC